MTGRARRNEEVARHFWRGLTEGDPAPVLALDPEIVWRVYGTGPNAGEYHGIDGVLKLLGTLGQRAEDMRIELVDVLAGEHAAVLRQRIVFRRGSKTFDGGFFLWLKIEDGTIIEAATIPMDQAAVDAFWKPH